MQQSLALVPQYLETKGNSKLLNFGMILAGVVFISLLAQVAIPLPFTPVPITGQTLGVTLMALLWGRRRAFATLCSYVTLGLLGLPIFSMGRSGLMTLPTLGYLIGMCMASYIVGTLADKGWSRSFVKAYAAGFLGSLTVFSCGLLFLGKFVGYKAALFSTGLIPFIPGDIIKTTVAALIASRSSRILKSFS